jgi:D-3-phosphoglycerate dehydrogenase
LIGLGKIGRQMVPRARGFGMDVIAYTPTLTDQRAAAVGARAVGLETLLGSADVISLHCPLTGDTRELINGRTLRRTPRTIPR